MSYCWIAAPFSNHSVLLHCCVNKKLFPNDFIFSSSLAVLFSIYTCEFLVWRKNLRKHVLMRHSNFSEKNSQCLARIVKLAPVFWLALRVVFLLSVTVYRIRLKDLRWLDIPTNLVPLQSDASSMPKCHANLFEAFWEVSDLVCFFVDSNLRTYKIFILLAMLE